MEDFYSVKPRPAPSRAVRASPSRGRVGPVPSGPAVSPTKGAAPTNRHLAKTSSVTYGSTPFKDFVSGLEADPTARQFVHARRAKTPAAHAVVGAIQNALQAQGTWRADAWATRKQAVEAIVCDLLHRLVTRGPDATIHAETANAEKHTRYSEDFSGRPQRETLAALCSLGAAVQTTRAAKPARQATFKVGPVLVRLAELHKITEGDFMRTPGEEIHIQRGYKVNGRAPLIDYTDDEVPASIEDLRAWLKQYNWFLETSDISCSLPGVDLTDRRLFRIFNNKSFSLGGRLYRGFWQAMRSAERHHIRIEGMPTVQLDYRATMLTLAYGAAKAELPSGDPYTLEGLEQHRRGVKRLTVAMLCVDTPLRSWPEELYSGFLDDEGELVATLPEIRARIKAAHPALAASWEAGAGLRLMHTESQILVEVLGACYRRGIVALPVHDCVVVREDQADRVADLMRAFFHGLAGVPCSVHKL